MCFGCTEDPNFCSGRSDGLYVVADNCSIYYQCIEHDTYIHECRTANIFSGWRQQCVPRFRATSRELKNCTATTRYVIISVPNTTFCAAPKCPSLTFSVLGSHCSRALLHRFDLQTRPWLMLLFIVCLSIDTTGLYNWYLTTPRA